LADLDLGALMKQAQALQERLQKVQEQAAAQIVEADAGGGMVRASVDGSMQVRKIEIDNALIASNDKAMLEDLIVVALNLALKRAQEMVAQEMSRLGPLGGLKLPGFGTE
jgi:DNA-binding YbaB/EbfC family protein